MRILERFPVLSATLQLGQASIISSRAGTISTIAKTNDSTLIDLSPPPLPCSITKATTLTASKLNITAAPPATFEENVSTGILIVDRLTLTPSPELFRVEAYPDFIYHDYNKDYQRITLSFAYGHDQSIFIKTGPEWGKWEEPKIVDIAPFWEPTIFDFADVRLDAWQAVNLIHQYGYVQPFKMMAIGRLHPQRQGGREQVFYSFTQSVPPPYMVVVGDVDMRPKPVDVPQSAGINAGDRDACVE